MRVVPIRWRPLGSRDLDAARTRLTQAIGGWQEQWFATALARVEPLSLIGTAGEFALPATSSSWLLGSDVWLHAAPRALTGLVNRALDLPKSFVPVEPAAAAMLAEIRTKLLDALFATVREALALDPGEIVEPLSARDIAAPLRLPYGAAHLRMMAPDDEPLLSIVCGAETLWRCLPVTANAARPVTPSPSLTSRAEAVEGTHLTIEASLGSCELTVSQLATLGVGDIITLDRPLGEPMPLMLASPDRARRTPLAMGKLGQSAGKLSLQLTSITRPDIS
ncbi:FliM/FliN family flagellar motor C-terminal domain-containing protein [Paraburkholderia phenazinium]|uniref:Type III flagellar switch regulator (C-ring) FliN C-term n=1 Tax=Paraburkholderia phenazinium TaxID=60549 RepID=A0A1G8MXY0_9BURK|nr:FliM/FliN family flagellar motor C-terminal domain-containing protein [Paraburkholderia phenazinium]SDI72677.1 Type III flagellar switch regulator (C-ring) FliN C-term [Paraburkholderia phenazinium]